MEPFFHKKPVFHPFAVGLQPLSKNPQHYGKKNNR
jgi:hypothetical protein